MKGIQNKIIIAQKAFIIHVYGSHYYKGEAIKDFWAYNFLNKFQRGLPWWQNKYSDYIRPHSMLLKACLVLHRSHSVPYDGFQVLKSSILT
jgi:hypothetical protein